MKHQNGFTLTELMIAMLLGFLLMGMAVTAFSVASRSARQANQLAELQQNAQLVMTLFQNELSNVGFWGGRSDPLAALAFPMPAAPAGDCVEQLLDSGSFPQPAQDFVTLYAQTTGAGRQLNCIANPLPQTELLQLKRLIGAKTDLGDMRQNRFYLETDWQHSRFVDGGSPMLNERYGYFPYQHLVFYLQQQRVDGATIPVLMRKRLTRNQAGSAVISTDSVLDGVERMHFEFGIDSDFDGKLNFNLATRQMPAELWSQRSGRIVSLKYHVLLRARDPDQHYVNQQRYDMGIEQFVAPGDHYRRLLISSSVYFNNAAL